MTIFDVLRRRRTASARVGEVENLEPSTTRCGITKTIRILFSFFNYFIINHIIIVLVYYIIFGTEREGRDV